jgi:hypothetical protein
MPSTTQARARTSAGASKDDADVLTIPDAEFDDRKSFDDLTAKRHVAAVYFYAVLDFLVQLAYETSKDFFERPHLYVDLGGDEIVSRIAKLRSRSGSDELIPSRGQRAEIYVPLVGINDGLALNGTGDFQRLADQLIDAATAYAERVYDTGEEMLRERVRIAHKSFVQFLAGLNGASLTWTSQHVLPNVTEKIAFPILRDKGIASVFGVSTGVKEEWPYQKDANAEKMVEEMSKQLPWADGSPHHLTRDCITNLHSIALTGSRAIAAVIDYDGSATKVKDLKQVITTAYAWGSELMGERSKGKAAWDSEPSERTNARSSRR